MMMSLDPQAESVLSLIKASGPPRMEALTPLQARELYRASCRALTPDRPDIARVRDLSASTPVGDIKLRLYAGRATVVESLPVLVYIHGGGFCIGDLDTHDYLCRKLAIEAACAVIAIDYRLAPENKFPAAVEDCAAVLRWVAEHATALSIDARYLAVGGDSAGGNLSAVMAHMARDNDLPPICFQMLLYPSVEMSMRHPSYRLDFSRFPLSVDTVRYFHNHYLRDEHDQADWRASPMRAPRFTGLAPAFILTAGYDPLRDEGAEYARNLETNDVPTTFVHMSDQMHGFLTTGRLVRAADTALELAAGALRRALRTRTQSR
jgi:acetyl esterase